MARVNAEDASHFLLCPPSCDRRRSAPVVVVKWTELAVMDDDEERRDGVDRDDNKIMMRL